MFRIILFLLLILPINALGYECNQEIDRISKESKIRISCNPEEIINFYIKAKRPSQLYLEQFTPYLKNFINSYNSTLLKRHLDKIIVVEDLKRNGEDVGGVSDGRQIIVCVSDFVDPSEAYTRILHHEFSSDIYKANEYSLISKWKNVSAGRYDYSNSFLNQCLRNFNFAYLQNLQINSDGFVANYGKTNDENDFNTYAEVMFIRTYDIPRLKHFPKFREKMEILKTFYRNAGYTGKFPDET